MSVLGRATELISKAPKTQGPLLWLWPRNSLLVEKARQRPVKNPWQTIAGAFVPPASHCSDRNCNSHCGWTAYLIL